MRKNTFFTLIATFFLVLGGTVATPAEAGEPGSEASRHADFLEWESGQWDAAIEVLTPEGDALQFRGEQTDRIDAGGWLITDLRMVAGPDGQQPPPYAGHGVLGYDPAKKKLVGIWIDSNAKWLALSEGTLDAAGHTLTLEVEGRNPATGAPLPQRYVTTRVDDDTKRLEVSVALPDGGSVPIATIVYTRRAAGVSRRTP